MVPRRLVVTAKSLLERRIDSHEVVKRSPLSGVAALIRFADDPKLLGIEWEDGAEPSCYVTAVRDAILALLLDAAQSAAERPIPVMPGFTSPGDVIVTDHKHASLAPHTEPDHDLERMYVNELNHRGKEAYPGLSGSSLMLYQVSNDTTFLNGPSTAKVLIYCQVLAYCKLLVYCKVLCRSIMAQQLTKCCTLNDQVPVTVCSPCHHVMMMVCCV